MAGLEERVIGSIAVLFGNLGGKYPDGLLPATMASTSRWSA